MGNPEVADDVEAPEAFDESFESAAPMPLETRREASGDETDTATPPLEVAVQRIPAGTRRVLDELFKAKFVAVRRVKPQDLR